MRRFVNADIVSGEITNAITLNRYAYANGNPVSNIDPLGLSAERYSNSILNNISTSYDLISDITTYFTKIGDGAKLILGNVEFVKDGKYLIIKGDALTLSEFGIAQRRILIDNIKNYDDIVKFLEPQTAVYNSLKLNKATSLGYMFDAVGIVLEVACETSKYEDINDKVIVGSYIATTEIVTTLASAAASAWTTAKVGALAGSSVNPGLGTLIGLGAGFLVGFGLGLVFDAIQDTVITDIVERN